ncbi:hypothetical protein scyTo_0005774 [Scyliorhinus torazame]|uniref:Uncharacterized protein n=1 Tax=Scyliorhinus torazame TaxID=75743 RepID=A0A401PCE8_SCYTO|nr:hypothetical protein [Scyliorhinus torazame]
MCAETCYLESKSTFRSKAFLMLLGGDFRLFQLQPEAFILEDRSLFKYLLLTLTPPAIFQSLPVDRTRFFKSCPELYEKHS